MAVTLPSSPARRSCNATAPLSERQQKVLVLLLDREAGLLQRIEGRWLLCRNAAARQFFSQMRSQDEVLRRTPQAFSSAPGECDLWNRISARIAAEEHASVYLGERPSRVGLWQSVGATVERWLPRPEWVTHAGWGMSGAVTAAVVSFVLVRGVGTDTPATRPLSTELFSSATFDSSGDSVEMRPGRSFGVAPVARSVSIESFNNGLVVRNRSATGRPLFSSPDQTPFVWVRPGEPRVSFVSNRDRSGASAVRRMRRLSPDQALNVAASRATQDRR